MRVLCIVLSFDMSFCTYSIEQFWYFFFVLDETLSQASSATSASASGVYEIPARLRTLHNLVIQYASQVGILKHIHCVVYNLEVPGMSLRAVTPWSPLMLQMKLPVADRIKLQSNKFAKVVETRWLKP